VMDMEVSSVPITYEGKAARQVIARDISERKRVEERLVYQSQLLANIHDAIIATDEHFTLTEWNRAAEQMYGWKAEEAIGRMVNEVIPTEFTDAQFAEALRLLSETGRYRVEVVQYRRDGKPIDVEGTTMALRDAKGQITGYVSVNRDITERKRAGEELRKNYELLNRIFATTHFCVVYLDRDFNFVRVNKAYADACGYSPEFFAGKNHFDLYPGEKAEAIFRNVVATGTPFTIYANPFQFPDHPEWGVTSWDWTLHPLTNEEGYVEGLLFALLDVTERKRGEEERARLSEQVRASREQLRRLARQVVFAQEEERQRISHELHDEAGQALTALKISLGLAQEELPANLTTIRERLGECIAMSETTLERIHLLAQNLRPPGLDTVGLAATLEGFCLDFARRTQLSIDYVGMDVPALPEAVTISFYRFLQDALTNVVKHAHANHVKVALHVDPDAIGLSVEDDGQGFDVQSAQGVSGRPKGIGLIGMHERFGSLGGRVGIVSQPGQGTRLIARVPRKEFA